MFEHHSSFFISYLSYLQKTACESDQASQWGQLLPSHGCVDRKSGTNSGRGRARPGQALKNDVDMERRFLCICIV